MYLRSLIYTESSMDRLIYLVLGLLVLNGCTHSVNHQGKTPLVEVDDAFLYKEDVDAAMPIGIHGEDSVRFAEEYIRNPSSRGLSAYVDYAYVSGRVGKAEAWK